MAHVGVLDVRTVRSLPLSAASGLVHIGTRLFVVADDELSLLQLDLQSDAIARWLPLFDGELPWPHEARKAAKPDCEALLQLPALGGFAHGALMALGSGSRPQRHRAALPALDADGSVGGPARTIDLTPLYAPLHAALPELNVEGAFVADGRFVLLQRGNGRAGVNARIDFDWPAVQAWLQGAAPAPPPLATTRFELGLLHGVPLSFTDATALPDGGWLFSAAAEDSAGTYADGACRGSVVGRVDAGGRTVATWCLPQATKVEGIAASVTPERIELLLVTDADSRQQPASLLAATLPR